ncbi:MAG TPA: DUF1634 domain-containing protein [Terriglobales bacterium]|nr:DUF1634 domain-containing protein [Terriglobales bacterium]
MPEIMDIQQSVVRAEQETPQVSRPVQPNSHAGVAMERLIGMVLLVGVLLSTSVVTVGGLIYVCRHANSRVHYRIFRGEPSDLRTVEGITQDLKTFSGRGIIQLGLILLVGVQVVRVLLTGVLFGVNRDRIFVGISTIVLVLLLYGLFWESAAAH